MSLVKDAPYFSGQLTVVSDQLQKNCFTWPMPIRVAFASVDPEPEKINQTVLINY